MNPDYCLKNLLLTHSDNVKKVPASKLTEWVEQLR